MLGKGLTLSTDDGEQAGEENDRMAPHHLFSPSLPPRGFFQPVIGRPSSSSSVFHVPCRTRRELVVRFPRATKKRTHSAITPILLFLLVLVLPLPLPLASLRASITPRYFLRAARDWIAV